jgi:hypothetical protein
MNRMGASYAVSQTAYGDSQFPKADTLDRIWNSGAIVYRNDLDGTVLFTCDSLGNFDITRARAYVDERQTPGAAGFLHIPPAADPPEPARHGLDTLVNQPRVG